MNLKKKKNEGEKDTRTRRCVNRECAENCLSALKSDALSIDGLLDIVRAVEKIRFHLRKTWQNGRGGGSLLRVPSCPNRVSKGVWFMRTSTK